MTTRHDPENSDEEEEEEDARELKLPKGGDASFMHMRFDMHLSESHVRHCHDNVCYVRAQLSRQRRR